MFVICERKRLFYPNLRAGRHKAAPTIIDLVSCVFWFAVVVLGWPIAKIFKITETFSFTIISKKTDSLLLC